MIFQFLGGLLGIGWAYLVAMPSVLNDKHHIPDQWVPLLCPVGIDSNGNVERPCDTDLDRDRAVFFFQFFGSFIFYMQIMVNKGIHSEPSKDSILKPLAVAITLAGLIFVSVEEAGACY